MTIVLPKAQRRPSFGDKLNVGIGRGLEMGSQLMAQKQQQQQQQQMTEKLSQLMGMDLNGLSPEMLQEVAKHHFQGQNSLRVEGLKQASKQQQLQEKQQFLSQILGSGQSQRQGQMPSEHMSQDQSRMQNGGFDPSKISDADIAQATAIDPTLGRELRAAKDSAMSQQRFEREFSEKQRKSSPEYTREQAEVSSQAQSDSKYNQQIQDSFRQHQMKKRTIENLKNLNRKNVTGKAYEKALERIGLVNFTSEGRREFAAEVKNLITDIKSILGSQFSQFEFQTILNAYPSADFSKEANNAILKNLELFEGIRDKEFEFANKLKKENKGRTPQDYQSQVNDQLNNYIQSIMPQIHENTKKVMNEEYGVRPGFILMFDPNGEPLEVPDSEEDIARYEELGAMVP